MMVVLLACFIELASLLDISMENDNHDGRSNSSYASKW